MTTAQELTERVHADQVSLLRFAYCDLAGITRCKAIHVSQLPDRLVSGVGLTRAQMALNVLDELIDIEGMVPVGEIRLLPDLDSYRPAPWQPRTATVRCDQIGSDRHDWGACPRSVLRRTVTLLAEHGITVRAAFEPEFYLAGGVDCALQALPRTPVYSTIGHDAHAAVLLDIVDALTAQGLQVEQAINEYGPGQQEVTVRHAPPLQAADDYLAVKDTVRGVARAHDLWASFAPKPFVDQIGSGAHLHLSLWDGTGGRSLLYDPERAGELSSAGTAFLAGVREHLSALLAVTAPSVNSYRRFTPGAWAGATTAWGFDNREAALRVVSPFYGREEQTFAVEYKPMDGSANPYLALAAVLRCGLDGVQRELTLPEPARLPPQRLTADERERCGISDLPDQLPTALTAFAQDSVLPELFGEFLCRAFLAVRTSEADMFAAHDEAFELRHHGYKY